MENGVRYANLWQRVLDVERSVIEGVDFDEEANVVVARVRPRKGAARRCGICGRRCPRYDNGEGRRRWRALDLGVIPVYLEADAPRVSCPDHGVIVAQVPWARHRARHSRAFEDMTAWLAAHCSRSAVEELMRVAWRTVGAIIVRVVADAHEALDPLEGSVSIGIDEISYKRGHRYLTVVIDHDTGRLIWAAPGRDKATLSRFFELLGPARAAGITHVSADGAEWIATVVADHCVNATMSLDPFHLVTVRREALCVRRRVRDPPCRPVAAGW
jgi:transposase